MNKSIIIEQINNTVDRVRVLTIDFNDLIVKAPDSPTGLPDEDREENQWEDYLERIDELKEKIQEGIEELREYKEQYMECYEDELIEDINSEEFHY